jgi:hypothetical protein
MTLEELIKRLEEEDPTLILPHGFAAPASWRGSYDQLAFAPADNVTIGDMLSHAMSAIGASFEGYKGGTYLMRLGTSVHIAHWGRYNGDEDALTPDRLDSMIAAAKLRPSAATVFSLPPAPDPGATLMLAKDTLAAELQHRFKYHPPQGDQVERYEQIRGACLALAMEICSIAPAGRERATALNHLDSVMFFSNAAIAREMRHTESDD